MADKLDKIAQRVQADLNPGESLLAAVKVTPRGTIEQGILGAAGAVAGGALGIVIGSKVGESGREAGDRERASAGLDLGNEAQVIAGVTQTRLLMWKMAKLGGKPKELLADLDLSDISSMTLGDGKLMGQTMPEILCTTTDGAEFGLRVAKVHKKNAAALIAAAGK